jgi:hypothetical protein
MGIDQFPQTLKPPASDDSEALPSHPLAPGEEIEATPSLGRSLNTAQMAALRAGKLAIYVTGEIVYTDIFGIRRNTNYCLFAGGPINIDRGVMSAYQGQNGFT